MTTNASTPSIVAIVGSTASGKSSLALDLARRTGAGILSCDSLLIYRDLNIGTAKPTAAELAEIPHFGINLVDLPGSYTAADYVKYAQKVVEDHARKNKPLLIVGGTGFYLKALLCGVWDAPPTQPEIRQRLEEEVSNLPEEERGKTLHAKLAALDPAYAEKIKPQDRYRVLRALEIIEVTGEPLSQALESRTLQNALPYKVPVLGIVRVRQELERRIVERTNAMFSAGLVQETKQLLEKHPDVPRAMRCVGYSEVLEFLEGRMTLPECRERVVISTRQLAKKQMTFFKTFPAPIEWFTLPAQEAELAEKAAGILSGRA